MVKNSTFALGSFQESLKPLKEKPMGNNCLIVIGMHRSGTSATAGVLHLLGADVGSRLLGAGVVDFSATEKAKIRL